MWLKPFVHFAKSLASEFPALKSSRHLAITGTAVTIQTAVYPNSRV